MARPTLDQLSVQQLLHRVGKLEARAAIASVAKVKRSLLAAALRLLERANQRAASESGRDGRAVGGRPTEQWPGEPALRGGAYRLVNVFGTATRQVVRIERGEPLPPSARGFAWRFINVPEACFGPAFAATPHPYLLLTPDLTIAGVNDAYLAVTMTRRDELLGCGMFEAFPDNPDDPEANGVANLSASLAQVLDHGCTHRMGLQRYDVRDRDGRFQERWWNPLNIAVLDDDGRLVHVLHCVEPAAPEAASCDD